MPQLICRSKVRQLEGLTAEQQSELAEMERDREDLRRQLGDAEQQSREAAMRAAVRGSSAVADGGGDDDGARGIGLEEADGDGDAGGAAVSEVMARMAFLEEVERRHGARITY